MGIKGLETFLETHQSRGCCYSVNIEELAWKYRLKEKRDPVIVVDAQSCYNKWSRRLTNALSGYQTFEFLRILKDFVQAFKRLGIRLVFYYGGTTVKKKRPVWKKRRCEDIRRMEKVFKKINMQMNLQTINTSDVKLPSLSTFSMLLLRYVLKCEVYVSIEEADEEIMMFAHKEKCFAVLAQDTDFVISQGDYYYLSVKHLDFKKMTTKAYSGKHLASFLKIEQNKLPLLASLIGNDLVDPSLLKKFHEKIHKHGKSLVENVSNYIRRLPSNQPDNDDLLFEIAEGVFGNGEQCDILNISIQSYTLLSCEPIPEILENNDNWCQIKQIAYNRHKHMENDASVWSVISDGLYESGACMEVYDNEIISLPPSGVILQPLRRRFYGILLYEKPTNDNDPPVITEWVVYDKFVEPYTVSPAWPTAKHPGLLKLWTENSSFDTYGWELFLEAVLGSVPRDISAWKKLPVRLILPTISVLYLKNAEILQDFEIYALMATIAKCYNVFENRHKNWYNNTYPNISAIHISTMIMRTFSVCYALLGSCGYPKEWSEEVAVFPFDGPLFQFNYENYQRPRETFSDILDQSDHEVLRKMIEMIYYKPLEHSELIKLVKIEGPSCNTGPLKILNEEHIPRKLESRILIN